MFKKILIVFIIILIAVGLFMIVSRDYNLAKKADSNSFIKSYSGWAIKVAENSISLVGNAIKMDWLPR